MGKHQRPSHHKRSADQQVGSVGIPRKFAWIGGLLVVLLGLLALAAANQKPAEPFTPEIVGEPRAKLDQTELDYGDVKFNTTITSEFVVQNVGDQPLQILGEPAVELIEGC
ncbi:MAG: DUF1573 domain-containing protein [Anaerolineae bacterium]|nr:DUF1573 domain-containing protein [Anaerolineae bacterium]